MSGMGYGQEIGDTLAQVNVVRQAFGYDPLYELPNAHVGQPAACLFYRALADCGAKEVYGDHVRFSSERQAAVVAELWGVRATGTEVAPPKQMRKTISDFDHHRLPFYETND